MCFNTWDLLEWPAQIAFTSPSGQTIYDFREGRARFEDEWRRPDELAGAQRAALLELVQTWERMMLARRAVAADN